MIKPSHPMHWLAVGLGSGLAPKAPGTFGTLGVLPFLALAWFYLPLWGFVVVGGVISVIGIIAADKTAKDFAIKDPSNVVIDEWAGMWLCVIGLDFDVVTLLVAFVLFRCFDIVKPWPISWADKRVSGGLGIMLDDLIAGGLVCACLHAWHYFF